MKLTILFPSSYYGINSVDEDLQNEFDAVQRNGLFDTILFDYESWFINGKIRL